jgi:hypothetical protein
LVTGMERAGGLQFEVLQVKEKFGGLRFYVKHANDAIRASLRLHRNPSIPARSAGEPGILQDGSWIKTLCDEHDASGEEVQDHG